MSEDLATIASLLADGAIQSAVDRPYPFCRTAEALRCLVTGTFVARWW